MFFSSQKNELSVGYERLPGVNLFYCDGSSEDARKNQQQSEDFLAYQFTQEDGLFSFIVCDGVGQSIDSGIAARLLGKSIILELPKIGSEKNKIEKYADRLRDELAAEIAKTAPKDSQNDPFFVFNSRLRNEVGSQVKFACGLIDFRKREIHIYWAGDIHFVLYDKDTNIVQVWREDNDQLWSTKPAALRLSSITHPLDEISRILVSSDGIRYHFDEILNNKELIRNLDLVEKIYSEGRDDIAILDVQISPETIQRLNSPQAKIFENSITWEQIKDTQRNRLYFGENGVVEEITDFTVEQNIFVIPSHLSHKDVEIQALSPKYFSSERILLKPNDGISALIHSKPQYPTSEPQKATPQPDETDSTDAKSLPIIHPQPVPGQNLARKAPLPQVISGSSGRMIVLLLLFLISGASILVVGWVVCKTYNVITKIETNTPTASFIAPEKTKLPTITPLPRESISPTSILETLVPLEINTPTASSSQTSMQTPDPRFPRLNECQQTKISDGWVIYEVKRGNTFYALAKTIGISTNELISANCYPDSLLRVGELLVVPYLPLEP